MDNSIVVLGRASKQFKTYAKNVANECFKFSNQPEKLEVVIEFVSEKEIKRLNSELRGINKVTDVLSFPGADLKAGEILNKSLYDALFFNEDGYIHFGDMAICLKQLKRQAKEFDVTPKQELKKLVIHSMLHLMGYDHIKDSDFELMNTKEIEFDKLIN